ncbi:MFS transporter [Streptomyces nitrosporeus]|uniref:MFS transporter n=1 Tax=Streptomyces nitrosporeus TaxID=28894 RepID=A0A5J6FDW2_9ACTN|nr:MFS transporter [Streptomyces nitrosporeus]QEU74809.1 MFS transporter [Streptomyces nitrosporeus]GGY85933.1 MFS transporter [Streptomyces nitrosporeus]
MNRTATLRRNALFALFLLPGLGMSSWVTRTPDVRDMLGASTAEMGLVLFGLSVGSMAGVLSSGLLVARYGARPVVTAGTFGVALGLLLIACGAAMSQSVVVASGLCLFGLGMGGGEIALNVEGADIERLLGRPIMPLLHGFFSLGTVVGAVVGLVLTAIGFSVVIHLLAAGAVTLLVLAAAVRYVPAGVGKQERTARAGGTGGRKPAVWKDVRLLLIGGVVLAMAFAEGAANDWLPLVMVDGHGFDPALGSGIFAVFAASMTLGRFTGGYFLQRFGRVAVMRAGAAAGGLGLALVIFADNRFLAGAAVVLWGLGASLGFPVALSAAGDSGENSAARVSLVATAGYVAFLVGPPLLGVLGEYFGLRNALIPVLACVAAALLLAPSVAPRAKTAERAPA